MTLNFSFSLSHVGFFVTDLPKMVDFYTRFMGFIVSDRGPHPHNPSEIVFLTRDSSEHHQIVLASGRPADARFNNLNQISFRVDGVDELRQLESALKGEPVTSLGAITHGNALSLYFLDPEGNRLEFLTGTPWYVPQPFGIPVDLSLPDSQLWAFIRKSIEGSKGYVSHDDWRAGVEKRLKQR